jgi:hypothetical protein
MFTMGRVLQIWTKGCTLVMAVAAMNPAPSHAAMTLKGLLAEQRKIISELKPTAPAAKIADQLDSFMRNSKEFLTNASGEDAKLVTKIANKMRLFQVLFNQFRTQGCLISEDENVKKISREVVRGALAAEPCHSGPLAFANSLLDLKRIADELEGGVPASSKELLDRKIALAKAVQHHAETNNERAKQFLKYVYRGETPACGGADKRCQEFANNLARDVRPVDKNASAQKVQAILSEAKELFRQENKNPGAKGLTREQADRHEGFSKFRAKIAEVWDVPGMRMIGYLPSFEKDHGDYINGRFLNKHCDPLGDKFNCRYTVSPASLSFKAEDFTRHADSAIKTLDDVEQRVLSKTRKQIKQLEGPGHLRFKTDLANSTLKDLLFKRPREFGAALLEHPEMASTICADIEAAAKGKKSEEIADNIKSVALAGAVIAAALPTFGWGGLAVGAAITAYEVYDYGNKSYKYETAMLDVIDRSTVGHLYNQPAPMSQSTKDIEKAKKKSEHYSMMRNLVLLGLIAPGIHGAEHAFRVPAKIANSSAYLKARESLFSIKASTGAHDSHKVHKVLEELGEVSEYSHLAERGLAGSEYAARTWQSFVALNVAMRELQALVAVEFSE